MGPLCVKGAQFNWSEKQASDVEFYIGDRRTTDQIDVAEDDDGIAVVEIHGKGVVDADVASGMPDFKLPVELMNTETVSVGSRP